MSTRNTSAGLTFVETIVVVAITTILIMAVGGAISSLYRNNAYTFAQTSEVVYAREGVERMVRDIREMTFGEDGSYPLFLMDQNQIGFYSDIDRDDSVEYVEFSLDGLTMTKRIYNATGSPPTYSTSSVDSTIIISDFVQNVTQGIPIFTYYDESGNAAGATTTVTDVRYVQVALIVNVDPIRDPGEFMLRSSAALRNLKSN